MNCVEDIDNGVRAEALNALAHQPQVGRGELYSVMECMKDEDIYVRRNAFCVLSRQPQIDHEGLDSMRQLLFDNEFKVRLTAITSCNRALPPEIHSDLFQCMNDRDANLRMFATVALGFQSLSTNLLFDLLSALDNYELGFCAAESLIQQSNLPLEIFLALTDSLKLMEKRRWAFYILEAQKHLPPQIVTILVSFLGDADDSVSSYAVGLLCQSENFYILLPHLPLRHIRRFYGFFLQLFYEERFLWYFCGEYLIVDAPDFHRKIPMPLSHRVKLRCKLELIQLMTVRVSEIEPVITWFNTKKEWVYGRRKELCLMFLVPVLLGFLILYFLAT